MGKTPPRRQLPPLPPAPAPAGGGIRRAPGSDALPAILAPALRGSAIRHGALGCSEYGKTETLKHVYRALVAERAARFALVLDDKAPAAQYAGTEYADVEAFRAAPPQAGFPAAVFRGAWKGRVCEAEAVAAEARRIATAGVPTVLVMDELKRALKPPSLTSWNAPSAQWAFTEGRVLRLSVLWTTQAPQRIGVPEPWDEATSIQLHRLMARARNYLEERLDFDDDELLELLDRLEPGEFCLYQPGRPWDRTVYRFPWP